MKPTRSRKWFELAAAGVILAVMGAMLVSMYTTWRECESTGGTTVRGLWLLECIK